MLIRTVSIDTGTFAQIAAVRNEMERALGHQDDPLIILIREEEEFDLIVISTLSKLKDR